MSKRHAGPLPDAYADGRTRVARRFKALAAAFASDLGGSLSHAETALARQAAAMVLRVEQAQAALLTGNVVDDEFLVRLSHAAARILNMLGAKRGKRPKRPYGYADIQAALAGNDEDEEGTS